MKKRVLKLRLSKETIKDLDLTQAQGGWGTIETQCCPSMNITNCNCTNPYYSREAE